jgi:23S rRNA (uracil1939-C5)-methyltransferase
MEATLELDAFAFGGSAVGTLPDGKRCFVRGGAPGDLVKVRITADKKNFAVAELLEVLTPSPDRIKPFCPYFPQCPGCSYQMVSYETELNWKQKQFERFLVHSGIADLSVVKPPVGAPARSGWRNKIQFTYRDGIRGYLGEDNRSLLEIADCPLARMDLRNLAIRTPIPQTEQGKVTFRSSADGAITVTGENSNTLLRETLSGCEMQVPAGSFFQINTAAFELLIREFRELLNGITFDLFADLYCGSGTFSLLAAANGAEEVFGIELDRLAVRTAEENLKQFPSCRSRFTAGDAAAMFSELRRSAGKDVLMLVDPPRTGLSRDLCRKICQSPLRKMIYVSCGPDTLARDLKILCSGDRPWKICSARMVDLFPSTAHFESIILMKR